MNKKNKKMYIRALLINFCLFMAMPAVLQAATRTDYAVDIIVFEDREAHGIGAEQWSMHTDTGQSAGTQRSKIRNINPGSYELLNGEAKRLENSSRYRVLARKTWLQAGLDSNKAIDVDIGSAKSQASMSDSSISGTVKIVLERYLHLYTDLIYQNPQAGLKDLSIKEHRRMRSRELHYIDHPLVGMLIKIVPVETTTSAKQ